MTLISREDAIERIANDNVVGGMKRINEYRDSTEHNDYLDGISTAIATVDDLPSAEAEWIPCSERLPNEDEKEDEFKWYLVTVKGHGLFVDVAPFEDKLWKGLPRHQKVIAWMPLPKPYRESGE